MTEREGKGGNRTLHAKTNFHLLRGEDEGRGGASRSAALHDLCTGEEPLVLVLLCMRGGKSHQYKCYVFLSDFAIAPPTHVMNSRERILLGFTHPRIPRLAMILFLGS
jgi:hypothetical protein